MHDLAQSKRVGLADLNAMMAVAAHKSFRRAASELQMSPSALSHSVAALEERIGVRLFHRTTRSVSLTPAGERFLGRVRPALGEIEGAIEEVNELREKPAGLLRLNASAGAAKQIFRPFIVPFIRRYPDMQVDLVVDGRLVDIVAEGFDAGFRLLEAVPRDMVAIPVGPPLRFAVVASPRYLKKHRAPRTPSDLLQHDCLRNRMPSGAVMRWGLARRGEELAIDVKGTLTLGHTDLLVEGALDGVGIAYVTEASVAAHLASGRLVRLLEDWTPAYPGGCLYYPHRHVSAGLRAFIEIVRSAGRPVTGGAKANTKAAGGQGDGS